MAFLGHTTARWTAFVAGAALLAALIIPGWVSAQPQPDGAAVANGPAVACQSKAQVSAIAVQPPPRQANATEFSARLAAALDRSVDDVHHALIQVKHQLSRTPPTKPLTCTDPTTVVTKEAVFAAVAEALAVPLETLRAAWQTAGR